MTRGDSGRYMAGRMRQQVGEYYMAGILGHCVHGSCRYPVAEVAHDRVYLYQFL